MKEHIVVVDEVHEDNMEKLKNINNAKESVQALSDSFVEVAVKMKELADSLRGEPLLMFMTH